MKIRNNKNILSFKGPNPLKNEYKKNLILTQEQKNILVGTLLGDAYIESKGLVPKYRYYFSQKESQKNYVNHNFSYFKDWCSKEPQQAKSGINKNGIITKYIYFLTCTHNDFKLYNDIFYSSENNKRVKIIPQNIGQLLNAQVLAYWFMDDGYGKSTSSGYVINTQNFSLNQQQDLVEIFKLIFDLNITIHKDRTNYRLYIPKNNKEKFKNIIQPYIIPSMLYKL